MLNNRKMCFVQLATRAKNYGYLYLLNNKKISFVQLALLQARRNYFKKHFRLQKKKNLVFQFVTASLYSVSLFWEFLWWTGSRTPPPCPPIGRRIRHFGTGPPPDTGSRREYLNMRGQGIKFPAVGTSARDLDPFGSESIIQTVGRVRIRIRIRILILHQKSKRNIYGR